LILDTDVLIWYLRGNQKARDIVENNIPFSISGDNYSSSIDIMQKNIDLRERRS